ncbi:hypothetical protein E1264_36680 [Actinomadura sp. KC216]|nr:hypothetical protein E1264_36680 [Actinomadura sp. KC216]
MATTDVLAPFQWLNMPESAGGPLGVIFSVAFFRGIDQAEVVRRFSLGEDSGHESDFGGLNEKVLEFVNRTAGGSGGGYVGVFPAGEWCVAIEPYGWSATDHEVVTELSQGCEVLAVTRHDYAAEPSLEYAIDGTIVTGYRLRHPYDRYGSDPDRLNGFMQELGMELDTPENDVAWEDNHDTAIPKGFALMAKVTEEAFTPDMLTRPMLVASIAKR